MNHRGPDGHGQNAVSSTTLGHTRLSIIDLAGGSQPMASVDGRAEITFNGEIYNYQELREELSAGGVSFATHSDTETILVVYQAWGIAGFARLRGMYAFAIADRTNGQTILARDPFGIKPLLISEAGGQVAFASEMPALLALIEGEGKLDLTSILETMLYRYPAGSHSFYLGITHLDPGVALIVDGSGRVSRTRFAAIDEMVESARQSGPLATVEELRSKVADTMAHHAIADVQVGCFLSGGLDSSVAAFELARLSSQPLRAYSVGFENLGGPQSELPFAREVARQIGADLTEIEVSGDDFADLSLRLSGSSNGPFPDPADIAMLKMSLVAARDVKVVLSGEGSDEALAGYPKYAFDRYARFIPSALARVLPTTRLGKAGIALEALSQPSAIARWMAWFRNADAPESLIAGLVSAGADVGRNEAWVRERVSSYPQEWTDVQRMQVLDLESWLPKNLLRRGDFTTMQASLEQRTPFLDKEYTPWAVALPNTAKFDGHRGKAILLEGYRDLLPSSVVQRKKSGFQLPLPQWLTRAGRLRDVVNDTLASGTPELCRFVDKSELRHIIDPASMATTKGAKLAWTTYCVELWLRSIKNGT